MPLKLSVKALKRDRWTIHNCDNLAHLRTMQPCSVDSLVTDPPAGIAFMGKSWDEDKGGRDQWIAWMESVMAECCRVMKPGAHGLVWALPRTSHWTAMALEGAGFEVRDCITHLFGSGFPKSLDISKAIDKGEGFWRGKAGALKSENLSMSAANYERTEKGPPVTATATAWQGWGTALKPASEHWWLVRKPVDGTVAENVLKHGTGGLNIDASRIGTDTIRTTGHKGDKYAAFKGGEQGESFTSQHVGRFPANLILSHNADCVQVGTKQVGSGERKSLERERTGWVLSGSDGIQKANAPDTYGTETVTAWECTEGCAVKALDVQSGQSKSTAGGSSGATAGWDRMGGQTVARGGHTDSGGASRFFYVAKASKSDKGAGNNHPTPKSVALMEYLIRLVTPPGGLVLDPFTGSGTTGKAALRLGMMFCGMEQSAEYAAIARGRCANFFTEDDWD